MAGLFSVACTALLAALLITAIVTDVRSFTIPNWLTAGVALCALPWWWAQGWAPWPDIAIQVAMAALVLVLFAALFAMGAMGGGDVKLLAALALWLPPLPLIRMLVLMAVAGGVLTLGLVLLHRIRRRRGRPEIPYGVAIGTAALWVIGEPLLNQFTA